MTLEALCSEIHQPTLTVHMGYGLVHHSYCHINLVKKTLYQRDIEEVGIYILYLPSDIQVQKYLEDLMKNILSSFLIYSISKSRTTLN